MDALGRTYSALKYALKSPVCVDCCAEEDDLEHTVFRFHRWWRPRRELEVMLGGQMEVDEWRRTNGAG